MIKKIAICFCALILMTGCGIKKKESLLFNEAVSDWNIYFVKESNFPACNKYYYRLFNRNKEVIIPKDMLNSTTDIKTFFTASAYDVCGESDTRKSVFIAFDYFVKKESGFDEKRMGIMNISADQKDEDKFSLYEPSSGNTYEFKLKQ